jgi:PAS domain S-box-containing protein
METDFKQLIRVCEWWESGVIIETPDGKIARWNRGAQSIYGYSADEIVGKWHASLVSPIVKDITTEVFQKLHHGEPCPSYDTVHLKKDGSEFPVALTVSPIKTDDGHILAFSILVQNNSNAEQERELFTALTQSSPIGIGIAQSGKFIYINR